MDWRKLERELVDILKSEGVGLLSEAGDIVVVRYSGPKRTTVLFSVTELAKQLVRRLS
jgi:hypothetical protein